MANAVLVIGYGSGGLWRRACPLYCGAKARRIIPNIQRLLEKELAARL